VEKRGKLHLIPDNERNPRRPRHPPMARKWMAPNPASGTCFPLTIFSHRGEWLPFGTTLALSLPGMGARTEITLVRREHEQSRSR
jgi:hypothetical protein